MAYALKNICVVHVNRLGESVCFLHPTSKHLLILARAAPWRPPPIIDFHNKIVEMYVARKGVEDGVGRERGHRFIRWTFGRRMGQNKTRSIMEKFGQNLNSTFYIKYSYA